MKILYIANIRLPTERAHGIQIMRMCEAFAKCGHSVLLLVPWRFNHIKENAFHYYNVERNFKVRRIFSLDLVQFGRIGFLIQAFSFAKSILLYTLFRKADLYYGRDELPLALLAFFGKKVVWEAHMPRYNMFSKMVIRKSKKLIVISEGLKKFFIEKGVSEESILVAHDGVDLNAFNNLPSKEECREKLNLPKDEKIALYTGHLYAWKGVNTLAEAARLLKDVQVYFVGGTEKDITAFKEKYDEVPNIHIVGHRPQKEVPLWLRAADVLILPNSGESEVSTHYTSPLKLFEYMASGTPIVASDLPSIREVLNEESALLVLPDAPGALARGIETVLDSEGEVNTRSKHTMEDAQNYSWDKRAQIVLKSI